MPTSHASQRSLLLVCEKCSGKASGCGKDLKTELKEELKKQGLNDRLKVSMVSCLDLCPKRGRALGLMSFTAAAKVFVWEEDEKVPELAAFFGALLS